MKGWFTHLHECVFILNVNMSGAKGVSPLDIFLFFWWIWQRGHGEGDGIISSPHHFNFFSFSYMMLWS